MKTSEYIKFAEAMLKSGLPFLVEGEPGIGKTALHHQICKNIGFDAIVMETTVKSPIDIGGIPAQVKPATKTMGAEWDFVPIGDLRRLVTATSPMALLLDDYAQGSQATRNACTHLIHARQVGEHKLSDHVSICAATNLAEHKAGTTPILEHEKSRFRGIVHLEVDPEEWVKYANSCDDVGLKDRVEPMPKIIPAFIAWKPDMLMDFKPRPGLENSRTPRTVNSVGQLLACGVVNEGNAYELISRTAGQAFAIEFLAFLKLWAHLPNPAEMLEHPDRLDGLSCEKFTYDQASDSYTNLGKSPITERPDVAFALTTTVAGMVEPQQMGNFVKLMAKFQKPVEALGMLTVKERGDEYCQTGAFNEWAMDNQSYFL